MASSGFSQRYENLLLYIVFAGAAAIFGFCCWVLNIGYGIIFQDSGYEAVTPWRWIASTVSPVLLASVAFHRKSLNTSGAFSALFVGFLMISANICFATSLIVFFFTASSATKFRGSKKRSFEENFKEGGQRNWVQVVCNGGVASEISLMYLIDIGMKEFPVDFVNHYQASWMSTAVLGALACSCGDTFASEFGTVIGSGQPRLITTLRKVPRGTNGAISFVGLLCSALGGLIIGVTYYLTLLLTINQRKLQESPVQWPVIIVGLVCGFGGSFLDSLLGATVQYSGYDQERNIIVEHSAPNVQHINGRQLLNNHAINLLSSLLTAAFSSIFSYHLWSYLT
ncbi:transmembrane protein 19 [Octopus sinensis]|uniref:Transmembrane protein 19 n=1 Tax=Octopus sinensis TaxID=2607531 RepID=A0A6P7TMX2_9MOLL|nr:transmembrane protein 19 [Octopus sinensis]